MSLNIVMAPSVAPIGSKLTITENGEYNVTDYAVASVNVSGGGGETWNTVFEGSVTTVSDDPAPITTIENVSLNADTIKVTFNGTEYECNKNADGSYGAMLNESTEEFDWSTYPFSVAPLIVSNPRVDIYTETAGTYTLKIEEPQSGGESDFSTAQVTVTTNDSFHFNNAVVVDTESDELNTEGWLESSDYILLLYKGKLEGGITAPDGMDISNASGTGGVSVTQTMMGFRVTITGDGTLTVETASA